MCAKSCLLIVLWVLLCSECKEAFLEFFGQNSLQQRALHRPVVSSEFREQKNPHSLRVSRQHAALSPQIPEHGHPAPERKPHGGTLISKLHNIVAMLWRQCAGLLCCLLEKLWLADISVISLSLGSVRVHIRSYILHPKAVPVVSVLSLADAVVLAFPQCIVNEWLERNVLGTSLLCISSSSDPAHT